MKRLIYLIIILCAFVSGCGSIRGKTANEEKQPLSVNEVCIKYHLMIEDTGYTIIKDQDVSQQYMFNQEQTQAQVEATEGKDDIRNIESPIAYEELEKQLTEVDKKIVQYFLGDSTNVRQAYVINTGAVNTYRVEGQVANQSFSITRWNLVQETGVAHAGDYGKTIDDKKSGLVDDLDMIELHFADGMESDLVFANDGKIYWQVDIEKM